MSFLKWVCCWRPGTVGDASSYARAHGAGYCIRLGELGCVYWSEGHVDMTEVSGRRKVPVETGRGL